MKRRYCIIFSTLLLVPSLSVHAAEPQRLQINNKVVMTAQNDIPAPSAASDDIPMGRGPGTMPDLLPENQGASAVNEELFGLPGGGYVHPFCTISEEYTDNLFNVDDNKTSNFLTKITPGIWFTMPRSKEVPITFIAGNTSAGGLQMALPDYKSFDRMNVYLLGASDIKFYSEDSSLNDHDDRLEGLFKYNLRSGLSFQVVDRYNRGQDRFDAGRSTEDNLRLYHSNIALADINWDFSEKFSSKVEFSNFYLNYKDAIVDFLDRTDNSGSLYGYYKYSVKTSLFLQYQYTDVNYDSAELRDNTQDYYYGGIKWKYSDKTSLNFKAGYEKRKYRNDQTVEDIQTIANSDDGGLALELALQSQIREKIKVSLALNHKIEESDSYTALSQKVFGGTFRYEQKFSDRLLGICDLSYENADYTQIIEQNRNDDRYVFRPALQYVFRDWMMVELAYQYDTRNSTDNYFDYKTNSILLSLNTAL